MKTQEEKIAKLKEYACAHDVAMLFDFIPEYSSIEPDEKKEFDFNVKLLEKICSDYQGSGCDDIERKILMTIKHL